MKRCVAIFGCGWLFCAGAWGASELVNGVMAIVNDQVITYKDVGLFISSTVEALVEKHAREPAVLEQKLQDARREGVEQLIERKLILHEFKTAGYNLPESIIEDRVRERIRERYGDRLSLTKSLQAQGMTFEGFKERVREDFIVAAMRSKNLSQTIIISPHKIERYYADHLNDYKVEAKVKLRMIVVIRPPNQPVDSAHALAAEILAKLEEGAPFADMASVYSEGSQRAQGGDWGWVEKSVLRPELAEKAFSLKPGQRSPIIDTPDGCYLMLVEDAQPNHVKTLPDVREEIEKTLMGQERARLNRQWIERLKAKYFVRYL
jgi:peptidyl-prolyl cis-trans isomerase SurA